MATKPQRIGKLPPRYTFILNPHAGTRLSKCPKCERLTAPRKFVLYLHWYDHGSVAIRKSCKWCLKCQLVMAHQDELEAALADGGFGFELGRDRYFVIGTAELNYWKTAMAKGADNHDNYLDHVADFKNQLDLEFDPGGWGRA